MRNRPVLLVEPPRLRSRRNARFGSVSFGRSGAAIAFLRRIPWLVRVLGFTVLYNRVGRRSRSVDNGGGHVVPALRNPKVPQIRRIVARRIVTVQVLVGLPVLKPGDSGTAHIALMVYVFQAEIIEPDGIAGHAVNVRSERGCVHGIAVRYRPSGGRHDAGESLPVAVVRGGGLQRVDPHLRRRPIARVHGYDDLIGLV